MGTYPITVSGPTVDGNYAVTYVAGTLTVTPAMLTLTIASDNKSKVYGAPMPSLTATGTGFLNGDTLGSLPVQPTLSTTATATSDVGTYPIIVSGPAVDGNYAVTYTNGKLTITPATLTFVANGQTMVYGATSLPTFTYTVSGLVNGDTASTMVATPPTLSQPPSWRSRPARQRQPRRHVFPFASAARFSTNSQGLANYTVTYVSNYLTVTPAPLTITADSKYMLAGSALPALTFQPIGTFANGDTAANLTVKPKCTTTATSSSPAGSYPIMPSGAVDSDYSFMYRAGTLTIEPTSNAVYLMPDPLQSGNILYIWGTTGNDTITVNPGSGCEPRVGHHERRDQGLRLLEPADQPDRRPRAGRV